MNPIRIGAVSYLNTKPLVWGLDTCPEALELSFDLPSRLADQLQAGCLDVALIPSIEVLDNSEYRVVSDSCIACQGPVWSVKFVSRVPVNLVRTVALDEGSRTSAAMTRVMLTQLGLDPVYESLPIEQPLEEVTADAMLVIGDRAMQIEPQVEQTRVIDMGEWWQESMGLPFVFAMWTARAGLGTAALDRLSQRLSQARDQGLAELERIAAEAHGHYQLTREQCYNYLSNHLHFLLGESEKRGLDRFYRLAHELNLYSAQSEICFHD